MTLREHEDSLHQPALCELLPVRDYLDGALVRTSGAFVAGYELGGLNSYYQGDEARNRMKGSLEALARALPERSMRMQLRFETVEGLGDLRQRYNRELRNPHPVLQDLDRMRFDAWAQKEAAGHYLRPLLHVYFCWDPRIHHEARDRTGGDFLRRFSPSVDQCLRRARREHEDLLAEFNSLLSGVEQTLAATGIELQRMSHDEMFGELKRAMNPLLEDRGRLRRPVDLLSYRSAREQAVNINIEDEQETYLKIGGLLYSFLSLKELPDATFPGLLRELITLDFPLTVCAEVVVPDQAKIIAHYKGRLRRMMSAQKDTRGAFRLNVEAQVAEGQLMRVLQDVIASSLKTCRLSLIIGVRTSRPLESRRDLEEAQRVLADRRRHHR